MVATIVFVMLLAWLICTAAMTFYSGHGIHEDSSTSGLGIRHSSGGPTPQPLPVNEPYEQ